jgi:prepilin-type N-terminal cleavage/methylation domain-containing protein
MNLPDLESKIQNSKFKVRTPSAFTLIELLTAMAVLAIILVMLLQVVNGILQSTQTQTQQMDSVAAARRVLDVMETDLSQAVITENAAILVRLDPDAPSLAFLSERRGPAADHRALAVRYELGYDPENPFRFVRAYGSVDFETVNLLDAAVNDATIRPALADGILAFQIRFLDNSGVEIDSGSLASPLVEDSLNGFAAPSGWKALRTHGNAASTEAGDHVSSMQIWIAAVDEQNLGIVDPEQVRGIFGEDPASWRTSVDNSTELPARVKSGIRILTKTIPLS